MVADFHIQETSGWLLLLIASLLVNAWIILTIDMDDRQIVTTELANIKVNLMALAAPVAKPAPKPIARQAEPKKVIPKVVTRSDAITKVSTAKVMQNNKEQTSKPTNVQPEPQLKKQSQAKNVSKVIPPPVSSEFAEIESKTAIAPKVASLNDHSGKQQSNIIQEAKFRSQTPPVYPRRAYELGQEGTVILLAQVANNGKPKSLKIEASSGYRLLDSAAMAAVKKWEFEPAQSENQLDANWVRVPVRFVIQ